MFKCPQEGCKSKVKDDSDYSVHMNLFHKGMQYGLLKQKEGKNVLGSKLEK